MYTAVWDREVGHREHREPGGRDDRESPAKTAETQRTPGKARRPFDFAQGLRVRREDREFCPSILSPLAGDPPMADVSRTREGGVQTICANFSGLGGVHPTSTPPHPPLRRGGEGIYVAKWALPESTDSVPRPKLARMPHLPPSRGKASSAGRSELEGLREAQAFPGGQGLAGHPQLRI